MMDNNFTKKYQRRREQVLPEIKRNILEDKIKYVKAKEIECEISNMTDNEYFYCPN